MRESDGAFFIAESSYPLSHIHGVGTVGEFLAIAPTVLSELCRDDSLREVDLSRALFLDIETTGLQPCFNTRVFLVGIGFFRANKFHVHQFFLPSLADERTMLRALCERLADYSLVVTFNGKTFDVPMLMYRYNLNSMRCTLGDMPHADLLTPARRLWKERLVSCRLVSLERNILGLERVGDVRGDRIPGLYNQFLLDGDPAPLGPIFYHNAQDILTLLAITSRAGAVFADPYKELVKHGLDFFSLGRAYESLGQYDRALMAYSKALTLPMCSSDKSEVCRRLMPLCKQRARAGDAVALWEEMVASAEAHACIYPYEELAKHYEHEKQDYPKAEEMILRAIELLARDHCARTSREQLEKKLNRVRGKQQVR